MRSPFRVSVDNQGLQDISPKIVVLDVSENAPGMSLSTGANGKYDGTYLIGNHRDQKDVTVSFLILERHFNERAALLDRVSEWATGSELRVSYRPNQVLECTCSQPPFMPSAWSHTDTLQMTFTAFGVPYWQQETRTAVYSGSAGTAHTLGIRTPGTAAQCRASLNAVNNSGAALTRLKIACEETSTFIELAGVDMPTGRTLTIGYDVRGYMYIKDSAGVSWYAKRTAESSDDVLLNIRQGNTVTVESNVPISCTVSARGLFL